MVIIRYIELEDFTQTEIESGVMFEEHKQHYRDKGYELGKVYTLERGFVTTVTEVYYKKGHWYGVKFITVYKN